MRHGGDRWRRTVEPSAGTKRQKAKERPSLARWKRRARVAANAVTVGRARRCRWGVICCHKPPGSSPLLPPRGHPPPRPPRGRLPPSPPRGRRSPPQGRPPQSPPSGSSASEVLSHRARLRGRPPRRCRGLPPSSRRPAARSGGRGRSYGHSAGRQWRRGEPGSPAVEG